MKQKDENIQGRHLCFQQRRKIFQQSNKLWGEEKAVTIIGDHPSLMVAEQKIAHYAKSGAPVLMTGESGVGKELFARSLYLLSARYGNAFVSVNCGRFHDRNMMVSELFGHKKGSFTGAAADHQGVFEAADKGVVFLGEVGELSPKAQAMLLRVLENKEIRPLGAQTTKQVDIRVISATHRDLHELVEQGTFRLDLYQRLNGLHLHIPPLRERKSDILLLARYFLQQLDKEHGIQKEFSGEALDFLKSYTFPGNIRELKNIVETGFWQSEKKTIEVNHIRERARNRRSGDFYFSDISHFYRQMTEEGKCFWEVIAKPFLNRDLNRAQVQAIIRLGLQEVGSYKGLLELFNIESKDFKKFLNFIHNHQVKPE